MSSTQNPTTARADYVVIGAGAAGSVLAARLSENPRNTVFLLEAGERLGGPSFSTPAFAGTLQSNDAAWYWGDTSTPQQGLGDRRVPLLAARALGGGSAVNTMMWLRGHPADFDGWAASGADGWGWDAVAPVFRRIEHFEFGASEHHGAGGPMVIGTSRELDPLMRAVVTAGTESGLAVNRDFNGAPLDGVGLIQTNIRDGVRHSVLSGYLEPAMRRGNLTVLTGTQVERLLLDGRQAVGVRLLGGELDEVRASRSVILAAGALRSPQLLMLSGIGPAAHLRELGIEVAHDLPGVGQNLQDHPLVVALWPTNGVAGFDASSAEAVREYELLGTGPLASYLQVSLLSRMDPGAPAPEMQCNFARVPAAVVSNDLEHPLLGAAPILLTPRSRGSVRLASADPAAPPLADPAYLTDDRDRTTLRSALAWLRDTLVRAPALQPHVEGSLLPSADSGEAGLDDYLTAQATSGWHLVGSNRMGRDSNAVVGPDLAVHGIAGLHVADASVMPTITRGNTQAPTIMIAERAAESILRAA